MFPKVRSASQAGDTDGGGPVNTTVRRGTAHALRRTLPDILRDRPIISGISRSRLIILGILVAVLAIWEITVELGIVDRFFVSQPSAIVAAIPDLMADTRVRSALAATGSAMLWAFLLGTTTGIILGYLMGFFKLLREAFYAPALFLLSVPKSIFIPIFLVAFGIRHETAIFYGAFSGFIYVAVNVVSGFDLVRDVHLRVVHAYGANLRYRILDVILPASLPGVFTGIWYGLKNGLLGVLILELFVSAGGLGEIVTFFTNQLQTDRVMALVLGVSVLAVAAGSAWSAAEKRLSRWRGAESAAVTRQT